MPKTIKSAKTGDVVEQRVVVDYDDNGEPISKPVNVRLVSKPRVVRRRPAKKPAAAKQSTPPKS